MHNLVAPRHGLGLGVHQRQLEDHHTLLFEFSLVAVRKLSRPIEREVQQRLVREVANHDLIYHQYLLIIVVVSVYVKGKIHIDIGRAYR